MCGMANTCTGGVIIFGIQDETHSLLGLAKPSETIDIALRAARMLKPVLVLTDQAITTWKFPEGTIITLAIPPNPGCLYQYSGAFLVRRGTHTVPLGLEEISSYLYAYGTTRWELGLCPRATMDDIDMDAVERYLAYRAEHSRQRRRYSTVTELLVGLEAAAHDSQTDTIRPTQAD